MDSLHIAPILAALMFAGVRIGTLMLFAPFFSSDGIASPIKAALTVLLTVLLYPAYGPARLAVGILQWVQLLGGEVLLGLLLGLTLQFIFDAAQFAGQIIGVQTGFSLITELDPTTQADTPVLSIFHQFMVLLIFLHCNVHHWLLRGLAASFAYVPPGSARVNFQLTSTLFQAASGIWLVGVQIAAPVIVVTMAIDVGLGFLGKAAPQLPIVIFGLSIKSLVGLSMLAITLAMWPQIFEKHFSGGIALSEHLLHLAK